MSNNDIDEKIKQTKLEVLKLTAGILSSIMIAIGVSTVAAIGWLIWQILG